MPTLALEGLRRLPGLMLCSRDVPAGERGLRKDQSSLGKIGSQSGGLEALDRLLRSIARLDKESSRHEHLTL
ncbi:MAG: hypothetical protein ACRDZ5_08315, partial [Acidimicrobiales bacterium]